MSARRLWTIALFGSVVAAVVLVSAGCGSSKKNSGSQQTAATYTNSLCSSVVTWENSLKSAGNKFKGQISKSGLQEAKSSISSANSKLKDELQSLGKPPTEGASQAKSAVSNLKNSLKGNIDDIQKAISGISSVQDIPQAASGITTAVTSMGSELSSTTSTLKSLASSDPWRKAFENSSACQQLASG
ncbi:MAG TPA: hypothetical protein VI142_06070 [Gaiellaceae bacterium]